MTSPNDPLVSFLYILVRDHLTRGLVEGIVQNRVVTEGCDDCDESLVEYAQDIAHRLHPPTKLRLTVSENISQSAAMELATHLREGLRDPDYNIVVNYPIDFEIVTGNKNLSPKEMAFVAHLAEKLKASGTLKAMMDRGDIDKVAEALDDVTEGLR
jgi:hypothetical protein